MVGYGNRWGRRGVLGGLAASAVMLTAAEGLAEVAIYDEARLLPGEFTWHPERSPSGPVAVVVSLPEQRVHVYRNGIRIAVSTCSTGKPGHETPTGVFTVLQKDARHRSSTYNNAPMPNMNRLTWDGIALHAGNLPGWPASHGCVRLPLEFSRLLFTVTHVGTPVILAGSHADPWELVHPGLVLGGLSEAELADAVNGLDAKSVPSDWSGDAEYPVVTVLATAADRRIALIEDGVEIIERPLSLQGDGPLGEHVFVLMQDMDSTGAMKWVGLSYHAQDDQTLQTDAQVLHRLRGPEDFRREMAARMHPGMTFVVSDLDAHPDRRSGTDLVLLEGTNITAPIPKARPTDIETRPG